MLKGVLFWRWAGGDPSLDMSSENEATTLGDTFLHRPLASLLYAISLPRRKPTCPMEGLPGCTELPHWCQLAVAWRQSLQAPQEQGCLLSEKV